ncbi:MAG: hypothetical protein KGJ23_11295 [Euryarchaeota archaeon]|nr:hypothetical protein [Euryarchaeota archaeon]MDE1837179.1 hypothetical protein [Euryarchaeota archaeon]MDE1881695.1 hypothetical protein [Euryarchaeota archaeon]MDE2045335.1 hypothetical protein [Thermoplasmata archaeon]
MNTPLTVHSSRGVILTSHPRGRPGSATLIADCLSSLPHTLQQACGGSVEPAASASEGASGPSGQGSPHLPDLPLRGRSSLDQGDCPLLSAWPSEVATGT